MRSHTHLQFHNKSSLLLYEAPMALTLAPSMTMFSQFLLYCSGPAKALLTTLVYTELSCKGPSYHTCIYRTIHLPIPASLSLPAHLPCFKNYILYSLLQSFLKNVFSLSIFSNEFYRCFHCIAPTYFNFQNSHYLLSTREATFDPPWLRTPESPVLLLSGFAHI